MFSVLFMGPSCFSIKTLHLGSGARHPFTEKGKTICNDTGGKAAH